MIFNVKSEVREYAKSFMLSLTKTRTKRKEIALLQSRLLNRFISDSKSIFIYKSNSGEVPTHTLIKNLILADKVVYLPLITKPGFMAPVNILTNEVGEVDDIDLIVAPCLSMDRHGNRIGYGGGYYDRFLVGFKKRVIVLVHKELFFDDIPSSSQDIKIKNIVAV